MRNFKKILIVEDNLEMRTLVADALKKEGYRVSLAKDGMAMMQALQTERIDLVLLDIMLPGEDGLTLCRNLRAKTDIPVIMLTAKGSELDRVLGLKMGADDFLIGQVIEPGTPIYKLTDPSSKWVEARISPSEARRIRAGTVVKIEIADQVIDGNVIQIEQQVDEKTRTLGVRIEVIDLHRELRPGQFVNVTLSGSSREDVLALPKKAVLRGPDGDWTVFRQVSPDKFEPVEIRVIRESGDMVVFDGIPSGTKVVTSGAFFIQSELAKSGFSVHNH